MIGETPKTPEVSESIQQHRTCLDKVREVMDRHRDAFSARVEDGEVVFDAPAQESR